MRRRVISTMNVQTKLLFYEDPYLKECKAKVIDINSNIVWLDQTIFFAESGGQESDRGTIEGIDLLDVRHDDFGHILDKTPNFGQGDTVTLILNWNRRYKMMRLHSAAHLVYFAVREVIGELEVIGSHVSEERARLDYSFQGRISDYFPQITEIVNNVVSKGLDIEIYRKPDNPEIRIWRLGDWETPCSGLHVRNTKEIGQIKLKRRNLGKGKERIEIYIE